MISKLTDTAEYLSAYDVCHFPHQAALSGREVVHIAHDVRVCFAGLSTYYLRAYFRSFCTYAGYHNISDTSGSREVEVRIVWFRCHCS